MKSSISTSAYPEPIEPSDFTFDNQRSKFRYIDAIGDFIIDRIPKLAEIWPLLGKYTLDGAWNPKLDEHLEFVGIAHYNLLKSLCYIIRNKDFVDINDPDQKYKNVIFHYAILTDCIIIMHYHILKFHKKLDLSDSYSVKMLENSVAKDDAGNFKYGPVNDFYGEKFTKFDAFYKFRDYIYPIRNAFIHNPSIDVFYRIYSNGIRERLVVKPEFIRDNKSIQSISKLDRDALIELKQFMNDTFNLAIDMLSDVWEIMYEHVVEINAHPKFDESYLNDKFNS